tara:strand:- start:13507 stop:14103 length:597 start_codon:yes stop_codon:yes gene_type:complete
MDKRVQQYFLKHSQWIKELELLREVLIGIGMVENYKWGTPVYEVAGKNVIGLAAFKNYAGIWFFHGSLLKDTTQKLYNAQEGKTTAMRQWRFTDFEDLAENIELVEQYAIEASENMKNGIVVKPKPKKPLVIPEELIGAFKKDKALATEFEKLNLTKKREFAQHILSAKRAQTKLSRLEKIIPMIMDGKGLNDKYRNC